MSNSKNDVWNKESIIALEDAANKEHHLDKYIVLLFICWFLLIEKGDVEHEIEDEFLEKKLKDYFIITNAEFRDNAKYLFYVGWMLNISPWYFGITDMEFGNRYLHMAYELDQENALYKWACRQELDLDKQTVQELVSQIPDTEFDALDPIIKTYFKEMISCDPS